MSTIWITIPPLIPLLSPWWCRRCGAGGLDSCGGSPGLEISRASPISNIPAALPASVLNSNSRLLSIIIPEFCQLIKIPSAAPPAQYAVRPLPPPYRCLVCRAWLEADELVNSNMEIYLMMLGVCTTPHWLLLPPRGVQGVPTNGRSRLQKPVLARSDWLEPVEVGLGLVEAHVETSVAKQLLSGLTSRIVGSHICVGNHCGTHGPLNPNWPPRCRGER